ncbi:hypothetical protein [Calothrix sp. CCY 0018]|uniref:hypothetical protein n=1 Tax=Calothrix sp. CCY 0018 TaxID=3103864 RepID=UPI0039C60928
MTADDSVKQASLSQDSLLSPAFSTSDDNEESGTVKLDADSIIVSVFIPYVRLAQALSGAGATHLVIKKAIFSTKPQIVALSDTY